MVWLQWVRKKFWDKDIIGKSISREAEWRKFQLHSTFQWVVKSIWNLLQWRPLPSVYIRMGVKHRCQCLLTGRCYVAEICTILLLWRCLFRWHHFFPWGQIFIFWPKTMDYSPWFDFSESEKSFEIRISSERASQEKQNGANFSFIAHSSV